MGTEVDGFDPTSTSVPVYRRRLRSPDDIGSSEASGLSVNDLAAARDLYRQ